MPFYERQPYIQPLHQIVKDVMRGYLRVPSLLHSTKEIGWSLEQRAELLDSLYRGFPVGTIIIWFTTIEMPTLGIVGGFRIPPNSSNSGQPKRLLIDGYHRLCTLMHILGPSLVAELEKEGGLVQQESSGNAEEIYERMKLVFELDANEADNRARFIWLKPGVASTPTQVPLDKILNRAALNRWIRERDVELTDTQLAAVDSLRDRLREYNMPVAILAADSLQEATESFKRINSGGTQKSDFHMVAALAFDEKNDPQEQFARAHAEYLVPIGWDGVSENDVLRVAMGLQEKKNPAKLDVADLAGRISKDRGLVERAFQAVVAATKLLGGCGVLGPASLPYSWQIITLAVHLGRTHHGTEISSTFDDQVKSVIEKWFWLTTYGEVFAGINSALVDRSLAALQDMLDGKHWSKMERDVTRQVREVAGFDFRTARFKACALAMARYQDGGNTDGLAHRALNAGVDSLQLLFSRGRRSRWWHVAIVTPEYGVSAIRDALRRRERNETPAPSDQALLEQLGIYPEDVGSMEEILQGRRKRLLDAEKRFVDELGLTWAHPS